MRMLSCCPHCWQAIALSLALEEERRRLAAADAAAPAAAKPPAAAGGSAAAAAPAKPAAPAAAPAKPAEVREPCTPPFFQGFRFYKKPPCYLQPSLPDHLSPGITAARTAATCLVIAALRGRHV
jgi:hypothetical protein